MLEGLDPSTLPVEPSIFLVVAVKRELFRAMFGGDLGVSAAGVIGLTPDLALFSLSLRRALKGASGRVGRTGVVASVSHHRLEPTLTCVWSCWPVFAVAPIIFRGASEAPSFVGRRCPFQLRSSTGCLSSWAPARS